MTTDLLTIAVPVHGGVEVLLPLLRALDDQARALGERPLVLVSDDASSPPIQDVLDRGALDAIDVAVTRSDRNRGPGGARNVALEIVETPWVAYLDADVVPMEGWLARAVALAVGDDGADVVEGRVIVAGDAPLTPFSHATEIEPPAQRGAGNVMFRTEVLRAVGGFDERYYDAGRRLHFREDADLAFRLEAAGATFRYDASLVAAHPPLPPSFWVPLRLARRYYFDPLLAREHPAAFKAMNDERRVGPLSLRVARHRAAWLMLLGVIVLAVGAAARLPSIMVAGGVAAVAGWAANTVSLCWGRRVAARHVVPVAVAGLLAPWVYLWGYWRGVVRFRHLPRL